MAILDISDDDGVRVLTLNRPDSLNAFNQELWYATADALEAAKDDDSVKCVVLTGTGRGFTTGQDLGEMSDPSVFEGQEPGFERLIRVIENFDKVLIAAVNGLGVGFGLTVLLHVDIALIAAGARLKVPFISLGVTAEASSSLLLPWTTGYQRAAEILFTEPWIDAEQAVADGLALRVVEPDALMDETMQLARPIGDLPIAPLRATKRLLLDGRRPEIEAARAREMREFGPLVQTMLDGS
jgi:enoyl-CoA hydratase/carnithine racemase